MCLELSCRINETATGCTYSSNIDTNVAAAGTTCDSGKVRFIFKANLSSLKMGFLLVKCLQN